MGNRLPYITILRCVLRRRFHPCRIAIARLQDCFGKQINIPLAGGYATSAKHTQEPNRNRLGDDDLVLELTNLARDGHVNVTGTVLAVGDNEAAKEGGVNWSA